MVCVMFCVYRTSVKPLQSGEGGGGREETEGRGRALDLLDT